MTEIHYSSQSLEKCRQIYSSKISLSLWIPDSSLRHWISLMPLWSVLQISEENSIFYLRSRLHRIKYPAPSISHKTWLNPWYPWCFPLNMPQFLFNQSPSASSLQVCRHCFVLFCFVFRDLNLDTFRCSMPSSVTTSPTTPCRLTAQFPSSILTYLTHISQNTVFLT